MGALLSILSLSGFGASCVSGLAFFCTAQAASAFFKPCHFQSSVATRIGYALLLLICSMSSWLLNSHWGVKRLLEWAPWVKGLQCEGGSCYGTLAVHRLSFALCSLHAILGLLLLDVQNTQSTKAVIQNGYWGLKLLTWISFVALSFFIPNSFFVFWASWVALTGAAVFILIGLILLVDFAHSWSESCLLRWEGSDDEWEKWKWILLGSTFALYAAAIILTVVLFSVFTGDGCRSNAAIISLNLIALILVTLLSVHPAVQDANPKSGLAQAGMVAAYCTYLITSAIANFDSECNPFSKGKGTKMTSVVLGTAFTFLAIAYSTTRAATRSTVGKTQAISLDELEREALEERERSDEEVDDEKHGTKYSYAWFHCIFALATLYVAMLLTDWQTVSTVVDPDSDSGNLPVFVGRSQTAMWIRIVSSWTAYGVYVWTLIAPIILPDRF